MKKVYILLVVLALGFASCSDWLDVQPKTSIPADKLFETESGFVDALTGFYIKMSSLSLYGKELSYGYVEVLSGNYDAYPDYIGLNWENQLYDYDGLFMDKKNAIYLDMYNIIANINNFLNYLDKNRSVIQTKNRYELLKGEALGLRAFLHFDLLRMFGPSCSANPTAKAIPYRKTFDRQPTPVLPANEVLDLVITDLVEADSLLKDVDSKFFWYDINRSYEEDYDVFLDRRETRMNIYAVKAMLARAYSYKGDVASKAKAVEYAQEVIDASYFALYEKGTSFLYGEIIFGLDVNELDKIIEANYPTDVEDHLSMDQHFNIRRDRFEALYEYGEGGNTDWRSLEQCFKKATDAGEEGRYCRKYEQDKLYVGNGKDMLALIRLPEMYYIIAACGDAQQSVDALNEVRWARGISYEDEIKVSANYDKLDTRPDMDQTQTFRINEVMKEVRKEYFAEGQLFFFYKYYNYVTYDGSPKKDVRNHYQWTLPDDEIVFGNNN